MHAKVRRFWNEHNTQSNLSANPLGTIRTVQELLKWYKNTSHKHSDTNVNTKIFSITITYDEAKYKRIKIHLLLIVNCSNKFPFLQHLAKRLIIMEKIQWTQDFTTFKQLKYSDNLPTAKASIVSTSPLPKQHRFYGNLRT